MFGSWRTPLSAVLGAALLLAAGPTVAALSEVELTELETLLRDLGFDPGRVDGVVDDDTIAAIRRYQEFAALTGDPTPSEKLLDELRGVAAAFAALNAGKEEPPSPALPDPGAGAETLQPPATPEPEARESESTEPDSAMPDGSDKVVVPPPPAPPKLKPPAAAEAEVAGEDSAEETAPAESQEQVAKLPPAPDAASPDVDAAKVPSSEAIKQMLQSEPPEAEPAPPDPDAVRRARIEAELAPYRADLEAGRLTRQALARQFNDEGRQALQASDYDRAVLKFSVAIELDPTFAGAYSNRGTAHQRREEPDLAAADFAKAKQLGFGGFRIRDGKNPFQ